MPTTDCAPTARTTPCPCQRRKSETPPPSPPASLSGGPTTQAFAWLAGKGPRTPAPSTLVRRVKPNGSTATPWLWTPTAPAARRLDRLTASSARPSPTPPPTHATAAVTRGPRTAQRPLPTTAFVVAAPKTPTASQTIPMHPPATPFPWPAATTTILGLPTSATKPDGHAPSATRRCPRLGLPNPSAPWPPHSASSQPWPASGFTASDGVLRRQATTMPSLEN